MKTIKDFIATGFIFRPALNAFDCTEIFHKKQFWFYNQKLSGDRSVEYISSALKNSMPRDGGYRIVVAGKLEGLSLDSELAFNLLTPEEKKLFDDYYDEFIQAESQMQNAEKKITAILLHQTGQ